MKKKKIKTYRVTWTIDVDATSPEDAARKARDLQSPDTAALVFDIETEEGTVTVDLLGDY